MPYRDETYGLRVHFETQQCALSPADQMKMEEDLGCLARLVDDFPTADLYVEIHRHPRREDFHVRTTLKLPGRALFTGERHVMPHPAYDRCIHKLVGKVKRYKEKMRGKPEHALAEHGEVRDVWPEREPDLPRLERAAREGDYADFRTAVGVYDDALEHRVGRWVQRYPELEARLGTDVVLSEVLEELYLNAFEGFLNRPADRLGNWFESLIDPSVHALLARFEDEKENLGFVDELRS